MSDEFIPIPVMPPYMTPAQRDWPISPKENFLRALRHEKPLWMPTVYQSVQWLNPACFLDMPGFGGTADSDDWFGTHYKYEAVQEGATPIPGLFSEVGEWKEKLIYPDLKAMDWTDIPGYVPNPDLAVGFRLGNGCFERLHMSEGFEQALCDILEEPEECKEFFDRNGQYKIEIFDCVNDAVPLDFACHNDDWANAKNSFFSNETYEALLLDSAVAIADHIHQAGCGYMVHCCGKMEAFLPYLANDIKADILEIQTINNIRMILDKYGDKTSPIYTPDPHIMYNPALTAEEARKYAREIVDQYGAHTCDGAGCYIKLIGRDPESYYAFEDEIFRYSLERYQNLS